MPRSRYKHTLDDGCQCMQCGTDFQERRGVRSNTWWQGTVGVRAVLCSEACRDAFDTTNLSQIKTTMEAT